MPNVTRAKRRARSRLRSVVARSDDGCVRFVVLGDIRGQFAAAAEAAMVGVEALGGRCDLILACGDVEPNRDARDASFVPTASDHRRWVGEFPLVLAGEVSFPAPLHFIGGDHEPWAALDALGRTPVAPGVEFLGRAGIRVVGGLTVAYLSGVFGEASQLGLAERYARDERCCYVDAELVVLRRLAGRHDRVDVLITHDWPSGLVDGAGDPRVADLAGQIAPVLHVCSHRGQRHSGSAAGVAVEAFASVSSDGGWAAFCRHPDGSITAAE